MNMGIFCCALHPNNVNSFIMYIIKGEDLLKEKLKNLEFSNANLLVSPIIHLNRCKLNILMGFFFKWNKSLPPGTPHSLVKKKQNTKT